MIDPGFNLSNAGMSNYFRWSSVESDGQIQITGDLINTLPDLKPTRGLIEFISKLNSNSKC